MTDAERLAKAFHQSVENPQPWDSLGSAYQQHTVDAFQRIIDSGVVTVNPPPDPALPPIVKLARLGPVRVISGVPGAVEVSWRKLDWREDVEMAACHEDVDVAAADVWRQYEESLPDATEQCFAIAEEVDRLRAELAEQRTIMNEIAVEREQALAEAHRLRGEWEDAIANNEGVWEEGFHKGREYQREAERRG